jgi:hypothetical protein
MKTIKIEIEVDAGGIPWTEHHELPRKYLGSLRRYWKKHPELPTHVALRIFTAALRKGANLGKVRT